MRPEPEPAVHAEIIQEKPLSGLCDEVLFGPDRGNTLWVRFTGRHGGAEWIGKFGCGSSPTMRVTSAGSAGRYLITAGGFAYVVDTARRGLLNQHLESDTQDCAYAPGRNLFIVADHARVRLIEAGRVVWTSSRIALDGIRELKVEGDCVSGLAVVDHDGETQREEAFTLDLATRQVCGATGWSDSDNRVANPPSRKSRAPWWRFWR